MFKIRVEKTSASKPVERVARVPIASSVDTVSNRLLGKVLRSTNSASARSEEHAAFGVDVVGPRLDGDLEHGPGHGLPHPDPEVLAEISGLPLEAFELESTSAVAENVTALARKPAGRPAPKPAGKRIVVDLDAGTATALDGTKPVRTMKISSGRPGHRTARGHFKIGRTDPHHKSGTYGKCVSKTGSRSVDHGAASCKKGENYEGASMSYFQEFYPLQGFHEGDVGVPSHGCLHLRRGDAAWLWKWAGKGTKVDIGPRTKRSQGNRGHYR